MSKPLLTFFCLLLIVLPFSRLSASVDGDTDQRPISGYVVDEEGQPIAGVTITRVGKSGGTTTDDTGFFAFSAATGDRIRLSMLGYVTQEFVVSVHQEQYRLILQADDHSLSEVVVVGYGTQRKLNLSGAVDQVDAKVLESRPIANVAQGLQGMIPNLNIQFNSAGPGASADINIRGITSINGGGPLILVDGVQITAGELNLIAPQDIANISVIKDASAAAIYGARAAFGVILITTKVGTQAGAVISYSNNFSWNTPTVLGDKVTDPYIFSRMLETATDNTPWDNVNYTDQHYLYAKQRSDDPSIPGVRINPSDPQMWEYMGNKDWARHFMDDYNHSSNHDIAVSGRSENNKARYYLSGGYNRQNSPLTLADDFYDRYSVRAKMDYQLTDWLTVGNHTMATNTLRKNPSQYSLFQIHNLFPTDYDINPDGSWANTEVGRVAARMVDGGEATAKNLTMQTQFTGEMSFWDNLLKINADYTHRRLNSNYNTFTTKYQIGFGPEDIREEGTNTAFRRATFDYYNVFNIYGTVNKRFDRHALTGILGFNQEDFREEVFEVEKTGLISASLPTIGLATGTATGTEYISTYALRGAFYRLNYIYNDRYIVELNGRYDGSSRFPKDKRFGFFPSGSVAWRVEQEPFMTSLRPTLSTFKLRASYGSLGNQSVSNYGYIASMSTHQLNYIIGDSRPYYISTPGLVSPNYSWEKVNTINFGLDLGFFNEQLTATLDVYNRHTLDMLTLSKELPAVLGASEPRENAADLKTKGWEVSLGYRNEFQVANKPLRLDTRFVLSDSRAHITRFDNEQKSILQYYEGMELGEIWGLQSDGLFRDTDEIAKLDQSSIIPWDALAIVPGWPKYVDRDGNGRIEKGYHVGDTKDLIIIGNSSARYRVGLDFNTSWNGIDFRMFWQGVGKRDYYPIDYLFWGHYQQPYGNTFTHLYDYYRATGDSDVDRAKHSQAYLAAGLADQNLNARFPHLQSWLADANLGLRIDNAMGAAIPQTGYLLNAAYLRLKNLTVGYTLPATWIRGTGVSKLRIFASGENVLEFSELKKYFDPETTNSNMHTNPTTAAARSGNGMTYPFQRSYSFGLNMTF